MNSLREVVESSPQLRDLAMHGLRGDKSPQPLGPALWDWTQVRRILIVRLRSIGDTVLATPSLFALKRFLPKVRLDVLVEDWVAPVLEGLEFVDNVVTLKRNSTRSRARVARQLRAAAYDVAYNLHGGTTATLLIRASGARHRVGFGHYQYSRLHQHLAPAASLLWGKVKTHSVEQQLALVGWTGVPVTDRPPTFLAVTKEAAMRVDSRLKSAGLEASSAFVLVHPAAAFATKQWATEKFARVVEELAREGLPAVVITAGNEIELAQKLAGESSTPIISFADLSLPEVTAIAARARLFVGNDSGIAHIAAAVSAPSVVIFGSSNVDHWQPWASAPAEVVREELECQPCHGYFCEKFDHPECINRLPVEKVMSAIERVLRQTA